MDNCRQEIDFLFETSWEVCNKVGGIYTVLSSKAKTLKANLGDNLIFIGPDVWTEDNPSPYFIESPRLMRRWAENALLPEGVDVRVGRWDIPGRPVAVLVKFDGMYANKDAAYGRMWDLYGVDSLHAYGDYDEGCAFARAAAAVIESIVEYSKTDQRRVVAHFDEWTTAMGLLILKADMPGIATVFTTHATSIGRSICGNGKPLYDQLANYNGDQMAAELNMQSKHSLEKAAAWNADSFTTVSDVTAREAEQLLDKKPDVVTPNGFELNFVPGKIKYAAARRSAREVMLRVASTLTGLEFPEDTFIVATSGRCEYRNKGIDMYLDALSRLSSAGIKRRILAFVMVPAWCAGPRTDLHHSLVMEERSRLADPMLTHNLHNYSDDPVNRRIHDLGFANDAASNVSLIYVPCYLDGADGIFNLSYYNILPGLDATVFASYYEPWGYTPLESIAFGVPTITTDLAGFGMWVEEECKPGFATSGVSVVHRDDSNYEAACTSIVEDLKSLIGLNTNDMILCRKAAFETAKRAQWTDFIAYYDNAYCLAFEHRDNRLLK
ncbi:MAG: glycogen/starch synthase [Muribaculaceae bacterium]|nr:glycogen/starch synthase [Muribaculaceae bacterium]